MFTATLSAPASSSLRACSIVRTPPPTVIGTAIAFRTSETVRAHASRASAVAETLDLVWGGDETVVVVSSDLSHFLGYEEARRADATTAAQIVALRGPLEPSQACGSRAIDGLLVVARRRRLKASLLDLRSSGDTAGDRSRVVGYGAFSFAEAS